MAERDDAAKAQLKVRLREPLRAQLEAEAKRHRHSLNMEIVLRLESSLANRDLMTTIFGDGDIFAAVYFMAALIRGFEKFEGKKLREDFDNILKKCVATLSRFHAGVSGFQSMDEYPPVRDSIDAAVFAMMQQWTEIRSAIEEDAKDG